MTTAEEILTAAGWKHVLVRGSLVGGVDPVGNVHIKDWAKIPPGHELYSADTPDTPEEAAAWLVALYERTKAPAVIVEAVSDEEDSETGAAEATPPTTEEQDRMAPDLAEHHPVVACAPAIWPLERAPAPIDAVYADIDRSAPPLIGLHDTAMGGQYSGEAPRLTESIKDFAPDEIAPEPEPDVSQFIFGDNLALDRLVRQGQVADKAAVLIQETRLKTRPAELRDAQHGRGGNVVCWRPGSL
jgi:hypothetical protein